MSTSITLKGTELEAAKQYLEMMPPPPGFTAKMVDAGIELQIPKPVGELSQDGLEWLKRLVASGNFVSDDETLMKLTTKKARSWFESLMATFGI